MLANEVETTTGDKCEKKTHSTTPILALSVCMSFPLLAQEIEASSDEQAIETIMVTAQLREESAQEVPISLSALNGDMLAKGNIDSLQDLSASVPSVVVSQSVSYGLAPIAIRGIGGPAGGGSLLTEQPVAVYVDGVYVRALGQSVSDFLDVDQLQILRGPQGTLYGRNSTAGAILISSKRPTEEFEGELNADIAQFDALSLSGALNIPLVDDTLAMRVAVAHKSGGDWAKNTLDERKFGGADNDTGRVSLRYTPTDSLMFDLIGDVSNSKSHPATLQLATISADSVIPGLPVQMYQGDPNVRRGDYAEVRDNRSVQILSEQYSETKAKNLTLNAQWFLSDSVTFTSITGYRDFNVFGFQDTTPWITGSLPGTSGAEFWSNLSGSVPLNNRVSTRQSNDESSTFSLGWNTTDQDTNTVSQEFRLAGKQEDLVWTLGAYYADEEVNAYIRIINEQGSPPMLIVPTPGVVPGSAAGLELNFKTSQQNDILALFADATFDVSDTVSVTGGIRYSRDKKEATIVNSTQTLRTSVVPVLNNGIQSSCPGSANDCEATFEKITPRAVLRYQPNNQQMLYASYAKGFTSGGFNNFGDITGQAADQPLEVESESITNYEVGSKNRFFDRDMTVNLSAFWTDYQNLQVRQAVNTGGVAIINVPKARIRGLELSGDYHVNDELTLSLNGSWLDSKITEGTLFGFPDELGVIAMGSLQTPNEIDVSGQHLTRAPEWIGNVSADYAFDTSLGYVIASASFKFQSETYFSETNQKNNQFIGEAWQELDLNVTLKGASGNWQVTLYADNVLDERYATQIVPFFILPNATLNAPRTVGISFSLFSY